MRDACSDHGTHLPSPYLGLYGYWPAATLFDGDNANTQTNGFCWG